jgi:hypothetical protein
MASETVVAAALDSDSVFVGCATERLAIRLVRVGIRSSVLAPCGSRVRIVGLEKLSCLIRTHSISFFDKDSAEHITTILGSDWSSSTVNFSSSSNMSHVDHVLGQPAHGDA